MVGKITDLAAQTGAGTATGDLLEMVDISDTSMAATGTNKKLPMSELVTFINANGGGATGTKLSAFTAIAGGTLATGDLFEVVDISDTTMAASGTNKKTTLGDLLTFLNIPATPITVANGGTGRNTATSAYGLIAAGTTATGVQQTV